MMPLVYILVLNWRTADRTSDCLKHLQYLDYPQYRILIIDNDSRDGSEEVLRDRFKNYEFIQTRKNLGYGGGNNQGIRYAMERNTEFVWILNPDVSCESDCLNILIKIMQKDPRIGICGPRLQLGEQFIGRILLQPKMGYKQDNVDFVAKGEEFVETDYVTGCSMLVRGEVFRDVGLFREEFFMYGEEVEFNRRAQRSGWKTVICLNTINQHFATRTKSYSKEFHITKGAILIARLERTYLFDTIVYRLGIGQFVRTLCRGALIEAFRRLGINIVAIVVGMLRPLKSVPRI